MRIVTYLLASAIFFLEAAVAQNEPRKLWHRRGLTVSATGTGDQEVPPVATETRAFLVLKFDAGYTKVHFRLFVFDGEGITQAHLHCGMAGTNGPVAAFVFGPGEDEDVDGFLTSGMLTNEDIEKDCLNLNATMGSVVTLANSILNNELYLNVHSGANPPGEVRAQIFHND